MAALPDWWAQRRWSDYTHVLVPVDSEVRPYPFGNCREHPDGTERHLMVDGVVDRVCPLRHDGSDANVETLTPEVWCLVTGVEIADPDGWRTADAPPWDQPIDFEEFQRRLVGCTMKAPRR